LLLLFFFLFGEADRKLFVSVSDIIADAVRICSMFITFYICILEIFYCVRNKLFNKCAQEIIYYRHLTVRFLPFIPFPMNDTIDIEKDMNTKRDLKTGVNAFNIGHLRVLQLFSLSLFLWRLQFSIYLHFSNIISWTLTFLFCSIFTRN
jgi:hypothetical protein